MASYSRASILAGLAAAAAAPSLARGADLATIRVGSAATDATAQHFYAHDLGYFTAAGLNEQITTLRNVTEMTAGVIGGSLDVIAGSLVPIAQADNHGNDLRVIALGNVYTGPPPQGVVVAAQNSPIRTGADLNGKVVSVNGLGDFSQVTIEAWIDANGGDSKTVHFVEVPFPALVPALAAGTIDTAVANEPWMTLATDKGDRLIFMEKGALAPAFLLSGWVTTRDWMQKNPDTLVRFVTAIREIAAWANKNPEASAPILAKYTKIDVAVIARMHRGQFAERFDPGYVQPVIDAAAKYGVVAPGFPAAAIIGDSK